MLVARTEADLDDARASLDPDRIALVPTMGALHEGHLALIEAARHEGNEVVASIFVNPLQFEAGSDLARYPADPDRDLAMLQAAGCAVAWLPTNEVMYPSGHATTITVEGPAEGLEGSARPGHFRGVATVVAILIGQVRPHSVWFGEKDWQQLQVVRRIIADLRLPVRARSRLTVRSPDGLALSSRNRFLSSEERRKAPLLYAALRSAAAAIASGGDVAAVLEESRSALSHAGFDVDYLVLADGETLVPIPHPAPHSRLLAAARLGSVRILDNIDLG